MKIFKLFSIFLILALALVPKIAIAQTSDQTLFEQGNQAESAQNYKQAEVIWRQVISQDPSNASAYNKLGYALYRQKKIDEAIAAYRKAIEIQPTTYAYTNLGNALNSQKKLDEAIAAYRKAIELDRDKKNFYAYNVLGYALYLQKKTDEAIAAYRKAIELAPNEPSNAISYNNLGDALSLQKKTDEAITAYRKAIELAPNAPNNASAYNNLGYVLYRQRKLDEAIESYRKAIQLNPKDSTAHNNLGNAFLDCKNLDEAIQAYREAIKYNDKNFSAYNGLGYVLKRQGRLEEAIQELKKALTLNPNLRMAQNNLKEVERLLALRLNPQLLRIDDRKWLPNRDKEPLVRVLRSVARIIPDVPNCSCNGTGWVVKREGNKAWIVTNRHVLTDEVTGRISEKIELEFYSEPPPRNYRPRYTASIVKMTEPNESLDLAVLEVTGIPDDIDSLKAFSETVNPNTPILVIGHPHPKEWIKVSGKINVPVSSGKMQILATLNEGNSGSPVLDSENRIVGVIVERSAKQEKSIDGSESLSSNGRFGFAYPIESVIKQLINWGIL